MIKNIVRFKQWAGEKLGSSQGTCPSEEFQTLQTSTEKHHEQLEQLYKTAEHVIHRMNKNISKSETGRNRTPFGLFGETLLSHSHNFDRDSSEYVLMNSLGLTECQVSDLEIELATRMKADYISFLSEFCQSFKEYQALSRKLEKKRLDYDAKCSQLQQAKKEKPDIEREVRAAKLKYEDVKYKVAEQMAILQDAEVEHCNKLRVLLNDQLSYHRKTTKVLEALSKRLDESESNDFPILKAPSKLAEKPSNDAIIRMHEGSPIPTEKRRAIYEHIQNHSDELTFHPGDIITVINKVDEGWWLGKMVDEEGATFRGIFPVNFTEPYDHDQEIKSPSYSLASPTTSSFSNNNNNKENTAAATTTTATTVDQLSSNEQNKSDPSILSNENVPTPLAPPSPASSRDSCINYNQPLPKGPFID